MTVDVVTFGCRLNAFESEVMRVKAERAGLENTIIINSCAVTGEAVAQARQQVRKFKRERPTSRIIVTGCAAQTQAQIFAEMADVDRVIGNHDKMRGEAWQNARAALDAPRGSNQDASAKIAVADIMSVREMLPARLDELKLRQPRAFVQVQNGCDHRCTFCIIPFGRGYSRSLPPDAVIAQIRTLVERGHPEIVLTGVDLTSYGADLPHGLKLGQLTKRILREVPELRRLRISSVDSIEVDRDLLDVVATDERLMPHLHLSLQSGDDLILKRMKRRHSRRAAIDFCREVRRLRPDIALGADIIVGFPTETDAMFSRSLDLVEECGLTFLHVFPFSMRPGTPAARMPQVEAGLVKERAGRLRAAGEAALRRHLESEIGATRQVLIESAAQGRTEHFLPVAISGGTPGVVLRLTISGHDGARLVV